MKKLILKLFALIEDRTFYQVRIGNLTKWITREEWFQEQKKLIKTPYELRQGLKGNIHEHE